MAKIYYRLIREGKITLDGVPAKWRDAVAEMLADGN